MKGECSPEHGSTYKMGVQRTGGVLKTPLSACLSNGPILCLASILLFAFSRSFLFPSDQQLDMDVWTEQADLNSTELHQMRAEDNCLFSINPKTGSLTPGQEQMVEFKYRCSYAPHHALPSKRSLALAFLCLTLGYPRQYPLGSHPLQGRSMSFLSHPNSEVAVWFKATLVFPFKEDSRTH